MTNEVEASFMNMFSLLQIVEQAESLLLSHIMLIVNMLYDVCRSCAE